MINKHMEIPSLFGDLRFIVIDEIHSLLRGDRGMQTFCLIERLCRLAGCRSQAHRACRRRSAILRQPAVFWAAGSGRRTLIPRIEGGREVWRLSMEHFFNSGPQADEGRQAHRCRRLVLEEADRYGAQGR